MKSVMDAKPCFLNFLLAVDAFARRLNLKNACQKTKKKRSNF